MEYDWLEFYYLHPYVVLYGTVSESDITVAKLPLFGVASASQTRLVSSLLTFSNCSHQENRAWFAMRSLESLVAYLEDK